MSEQERLSIKINIAGRTYPLTVLAREEENIRKAARLLNERMKSYEENFSVKDTQDLLAMCALEFSVKMLSLEGQSSASPEGYKEMAASVSEMEQYLSKYLNGL
jgi:cell division protein ZapA